MIKGSITAKPQVFAAAVTWAAKFVAQRPTVPVQGGLRLTVGAGELTIEAYNENIQAVAAVPIEGDGTGDVIVSGRLLAELVKTFPDKPVEIGEDDGGMTIAAGRWKGTLPAMDGDWPADVIVAPAPVGTVDGAAFAEAIGQAGTASTDDEKKPAPLHCVYLTFDEREVTAMATDGHRMARAATPFEVTDEVFLAGDGASALLWGHVIVDAAAAFIGPDPIVVGLGPNVMSLSSKTRRVVLRQTVLDGGYGAAPLIGQMMAVEHPRAVQIKVADLLMPMKRANIVSGDKAAPVAIEVAAGKVWIHAKADDIARKSAEDVDAEYSGPEFTMALNPKYLAEALSSAPGDTVRIDFNEGEQRPGRPWHILITVPGVETWHHVLMPIKIR